MENRVAETKSAAQGPAGAAAPASADRFRLTLVTGVILLALALAVMLLRLQRLSEFPPGVDAGEGVNGIDALRVLQGEHAVFFPNLGGREGLAMYAIALSISFFGRNEFALRLPTALASAGTVFVVFWLGQLLFGRDGEGGRSTPWRGLMVGAASAGLLAVSLGQTILGRTAFRTSWLPLVLSLCLALLWQGWRQRERGGSAWWWIVLAGVCAGLLPYTYIPARLVPFLFLFFGLSFLLPLPAATRGSAGASSHRTRIAQTFDRVRPEIPWIVVFVGVAGLVAAPILVHYALHPEHFVSRSGPISVFDPFRNQGDLLGTLLRNVWDHLLVFGFHGDPIWRHNFAGRPMLNPVEALFFWLGVGMAVWRWQRRPAYRLLLLWLFILIVPALLSKDFPPSVMRMIGAAPAVYLLIGVGMWEVYQVLEKRFFRQEGSRAAYAAGIVVGVLFLVQGVISYRTYFQQWAAAPETYEAYGVEWSELAQALNAQPPAVDTVYLVPGYTWFSIYFWQYTLGYLYQGTTPTRMVPVGAYDLAPAVGSTLAETEILSTVKFVDWDNDIVGGDARADAQIAHLLGKYGRYRGSEKGPSFRTHSYTDVSLGRSWTFYDELEPIEVHYDGGVSLLGFAWGQGTEQLSLQEPFIVGGGESMWVAMQWQSAPGLEVEYSISLRLHNMDGGVVYQQDAVLRDPGRASTNKWSAGERIDTLHYLDVPVDLASGEYEMRMVVYDFATLKPTVEIGVWEPETELVRLRIERGE